MIMMVCDAPAGSACSPVLLPCRLVLGVSAGKTMYHTQVCYGVKALGPNWTPTSLEHQLPLQGGTKGGEASGQRAQFVGVLVLDRPIRMS